MKKSIKKEKVQYRCLSIKDRLDLIEWNKKKSVSNKSKGGKKKSLNKMARELRGKSYQDFLKSDYWRIVRYKVLKRDGHRCVICKNKYALEVHHDSYKNHFKEHEHLGDLMTLCRDCHKEHHYSS